MPDHAPQSVIRLPPNQLPALDTLVEAAEAEGVGNMAILARRWASGEDRFDRTGEALFGAQVEHRLIAVGGISVETAHPAAMRVRRFYVHPDFRRLGIGRMLARAVMAQGLTVADTLTCNARASAAAAPFWESLGFTPVHHASWTHVFQPIPAARGLAKRGPAERGPVERR